MAFGPQTLYGTLFKIMACVEPSSNFQTLTLPRPLLLVSFVLFAGSSDHDFSQILQ
jgi:hypothetical protein